MKKTITVSFDEDKLKALKIYLEKKNLSVEDELETTLGILYNKNVPASVKEFLALTSDSISKTENKPSPKKNVSSSVVGADNQEVVKNE